MSDTHMQFLARQCSVNRHAFGPMDRQEGVLDHMAQEMEEVRNADGHIRKAEEWVDLVILAQDGLLRAARESLRERMNQVPWDGNDRFVYDSDDNNRIIGHISNGVAEPTSDYVAASAMEILIAKRDKVEIRSYPDWREQDPNKATNHDRGVHD